MSLLLFVLSFSCVAVLPAEAQRRPGIPVDPGPVVPSTTMTPMVPTDWCDELGDEVCRVFPDSPSILRFPGPNIRISGLVPSIHGDTVVMPADAFHAHDDVAVLGLFQQPVLKDVHPDALMGLSNLQVVYLFKNDLQVIRPEVFNYMPYLRYVDLSFNPALVCAHPRLYQKLQKTGQDTVNSLFVNRFLDTPYLFETSFTLFLRHKPRDASSCPATPGPAPVDPNHDWCDTLGPHRCEFFEHSQALSVGYLRADQPIHVSTDAFKNHLNITELSIYGEPTVKGFQMHALQNLHSLRKVYLFMNNIQQIQPEIFNDLPTLHYLDLSMNPALVCAHKRLYKQLKKLGICPMTVSIVIQDHN